MILLMVDLSFEDQLLRLKETFKHAHLWLEVLVCPAGHLDAFSLNNEVNKSIVLSFEHSVAVVIKEFLEHVMPRVILFRRMIVRVTLSILVTFKLLVILH